MKRIIMTILLIGLVLASYGETRIIAEPTTLENAKKEIKIQRKFFDKQVVLGKKLRDNRLDYQTPYTERKPNLTYHYGHYGQLYFAGSYWNTVVIVANEKEQVVKITFQKYSEVDNLQELYNVLRNALVEKYGESQSEKPGCINGGNWRDDKTDLILNYEKCIGRDGKERYYLTIQYQDYKMVEELRDPTYEL